MKNLVNKCFFWLLSMYWLRSRRRELDCFQFSLLAVERFWDVYSFLLFLVLILKRSSCSISAPWFLGELVSPLTSLWKAFISSDEFSLFSWAQSLFGLWFLCALLYLQLFQISIANIAGIGMKHRHKPPQPAHRQTHARKGTCVISSKILPCLWY